MNLDETGSHRCYSHPHKVRNPQSRPTSNIEHRTFLRDGGGGGFGHSHEKIIFSEEFPGANRPIFPVGVPLPFLATGPVRHRKSMESGDGGMPQIYLSVKQLGLYRHNNVGQRTERLLKWVLKAVLADLGLYPRPCNDTVQYLLHGLEVFSYGYVKGRQNQLRYEECAWMRSRNNHKCLVCTFDKKMII